MPKISKSRDELEIELGEQIQALRASMASYDGGALWEAKRLASSIYILCFDGSGRTKSLLGMLGLKGSMRFTSSYTEPNIEFEPLIVIPSTPLLCLAMDSQGSGYAPYFQHHAATAKIQEYSRLPFNKWWDQSIFHPTAKMNLSRKNIIFHVRAKDGGAHVDDHLSDFDYRLLRTVGDPRVLIGGSNQAPQPPGNVIWPIIRQIAWEIDYSLIDAGL